MGVHIVSMSFVQVCVGWTSVCCCVATFVCLCGGLVRLSVSVFCLIDWRRLQLVVSYTRVCLFFDRLFLWDCQANFAERRFSGTIRLLSWQLHKFQRG